MSYTPTEWESADIVTATRINKLETAVGDMNMSYTPNVWSDGDILSADKMNALEQAVASGGGGSSDFSTAEVTISGYNGSAFALEVIYEETFPFGYKGVFLYNNNQFSRDCFTEDETPITWTLYYIGDSFVCYPGNTYVSSTGDVVYDENNNTLTITGDCTITGWISD